MGVRESRRIRGEYVLTEQDMIENTQFEDCIALCSYPIDLHPAKGSMTGTGFKKEETELADVYQLPYRILLPQKVENLLVAGRCVSATHAASGAIRVMPPVFAMAQAAGTAAALCVGGGCDPKTINIIELKQKLKEDNQCM